MKIQAKIFATRHDMTNFNNLLEDFGSITTSYAY